MNQLKNILSKSIILILLVIFQLKGFSNHISGTIKDNFGEPLPFASVYVKNTTYGVSSNAFGEYFLELKNGEHNIIFSFIGYESVEKKVILSGSPKVFNIVLNENAKDLIELEVVSNTKNKALEIIKKAKEAKKNFIDVDYSCTQYAKNSIEKRKVKIRKYDSIEPWEIDTSSNINFTNDILKFIESYGKYYHLKKNKSYWDYYGYHDFADTKPKDDYTIIQSFEEFGEYDITPQYKIDDPYLSLMDLVELELNLYQNNIKTSISEKPIISPLSNGSRTFYKYDYLGVIIENDTHKIHKIQLTPRFKNEPLLKGVLFIDDETHFINSFELAINGPKQSSFKIENLHIIQDYNNIEGNPIVNRKIIDFTIKDGDYKILGNANAVNYDFTINPSLPKKFNKNEIKFYGDSIDQFSIEAWENLRPIDLKDNELEYISYTDSLRDYYNSEAYILEKDSIYNKITLGKILWNGIGHRNRYKGYSFYLWPIISQFNPFGIGGYRHNVGFNFKKNINEKYKISTRNSIDYGFTNKDLRGSTGISIITNDRKYKQLTIGLGDQYKAVNRFSSLSTAFSRTNYVRSKHLETAYKTELINGLYAEFKALYCNQSPLTLLDLSDDIFSPIDSILDIPQTDNFEEPYTKLETRIQFTWLPFQKFYYKKNNKIVLGTDYPTVNFIYRKGFPAIFNSEVNFDYAEIRVNDEFTIPHLGDAKWNVELGSFLNKENLRVIEWKYFRGSDFLFFSNPLKSFQMMGPTLTSEFSYLRGNFIHNFNGNILGKIPLINRLNLQLSGGASTLIIPEEDLIHFESYIGIARPFKLWGELVKFGLYGCTSVNSYTGSTFELKIGASSFNPFTKKWDY